MAGEWWRSAVVYQIYPRSFQDSDADGIGDLKGIAERLPYVASLGVDAVWIAPFYRSPMRDYGYDVQDYRAVDPMFGSIEDFQEVVDRAHALGLKVLIDMVWSHTAESHPWFVASRASRDNAKADWYVWADPRPDGTPPNNWLSVFGGGAWTWEPRRRQYFLHHFLSSQPALNWRNPEMVAALMEAGRFWLDRGVDGFRLDAVDFLLHDEGLRDNPVRELAEIPAKPFGMQEHLHDMVQPQALAAMAGIRAMMDEYPRTTTIAELSSVGDPIERAGRYTSGSERLHCAYSLGLMRRPLAQLGQSITEVEAKIGGGWLCWAFSNHDIERVASRWGDGSAASARALLAVQVALRGTLCLYQGDELGLTEAELAFDDLHDPYGITFWPDYKGRDGCRTPMPWSAKGKAAGFTTGKPWLPVPQSHRNSSVDTQEADPDSPLNTLRRLLRWRRTRPELLDGPIQVVDMPGLLALRRGGLLCLFNLSAEARRVSVAGRLVEGVGCAAQGEELVFPTWGAAFLETS